MDGHELIIIEFISCAFVVLDVFVVETTDGFGAVAVVELFARLEPIRVVFYVGATGSCGSYGSFE